MPLVLFNTFLNLIELREIGSESVVDKAEDNGVRKKHGHG
jgi:hypothetical protein